MKPSESFTIVEPSSSPSSSDESDRKGIYSPKRVDACACDERELRLRMLLRGYRVSSTKLANTLQGSIWRGINTNPDRDGRFNPNIVVKVANKKLSITGTTVVEDQFYDVKENILSETRVLRYLTEHGTRYGLKDYCVTYIDFFHDTTNFYLVMEDGGSRLFDIVNKAHHYIACNKLSHLQWQNVCKVLFKKMITFVDILHSMHVCHLDISLENILVKDVSSLLANPHPINARCRVKFCDFGLSQVFDAKANPQFVSNKWVGKRKYQSPEIYAKKANFNAKAADIWSLGVCLFAMLTGAMPFEAPSPSDPHYQWIISGHMLQVIKQWKKLSYIDMYSLDILFRIFKTEHKRIGIKQLVSHTWLQYYYH